MTAADWDALGNLIAPRLHRRALVAGAAGLATLVVAGGSAALAQTVTPEADPEPDPEADPEPDSEEGEEEGEGAEDVIAPRGTPTARGTLTLYSGQHGEPTHDLVATFADATGVTVRLRSGEDAELANQIVAEGSSSPADLIYTENSPALTFLSEQGLLAKVAPQTLGLVPEQYNSAQGDWVGVAARATVLVYNPALLPEADLPASVLDLARPEWAGKIGIAPAESDFHPLVTAVIVLEGEEAARAWAEGLAHNAVPYRGNNAILQAVDTGDLAAGIINHYYWFRMAQEVGEAQMHSQLYYFGHEDPGALVNVSGAGALASSPQPELAQEFLAFLVGKQGQEVLAHSDYFEYPLGSGVAAPPGLKPLAELDPPRLPISELGDSQAAIELLQDVGLL